MLNNSKASTIFALKAVFTEIATELGLAALPFAATETPITLGTLPFVAMSPLVLGLPGHESTSGFQLDLMIEDSKESTTGEFTADAICQLFFTKLHLVNTANPGSCWIPHKDFSKPGTPQAGQIEIRILTGWGPGGFNSRPQVIHRRLQFEIFYKN